MEGREKMVQIYNAMADMALDTLKKINESKSDNGLAVFDEEVLEMVRTIQSLYETISRSNIEPACTLIDPKVLSEIGTSCFSN